MRRLSALLLLGLAVGAAGASDSAANGASHSAANGSSQRYRVTVYFLADGQTAPLGVRRTVMRRGSAPLARVALRQLLAGPKAGERREGLTTAVPAGVRIRSFSIVRRAHGSTATADLASLPPLSSVSGVTIARIGTQIARTVIGLSDVTRVRIESNGRPWNFWLMSGGVSSRPWDYQMLVGLWVGDFKALP
jgi:spore germination protein GerM